MEMSSHFGRYQFTSIGPKGHIKMAAHFTRLKTRNTYNLAFGILKQDNTIDDEIENNNNDRNTILATVFDIISVFTSRHPDSFVYFSGSSPSRNRLYRMAISVNFRFLSEFYHIWGDTTEGKVELFQPSRNYNAFLIKRN